MSVVVMMMTVFTIMMMMMMMMMMMKGSLRLGKDRNIVSYLQFFLFGGWGNIQKDLLYPTRKKDARTGEG